MYHHVSATVQPGRWTKALTLRPEEFAQQLSFLQAHGCETLTVDTLVSDVRAGALRGCEIAITFDDGYADNASVVAPMLSAAGDTATFYISSGLVGAPDHVSVRALQALAEAGFQIGAHTINHVDLTGQTDAVARQEITGSRAALRGWTATAVSSFAYPAGQHDARVEHLVAAAGFRNAITTRPGQLTVGATADPYALPRYRIERDTGSALLARIVGPGRTPGMSAAERNAIARERAEGNDAALAERIGAAFLNAGYPEQLLKVRVLRASEATVVGLMLSGVKFHAEVDRQQFEGDVGGMIERAFDARPDIAEVDVWAEVPLRNPPTSDVSGDTAEPTTRTVFSAAVTRAARESGESRSAMLGMMYWENGFLTKVRP
jgi:peptidoglycan/xylan/chitin deacetylase (PgdA/CDA1 family)